MESDNCQYLKTFSFEDLCILLHLEDNIYPIFQISKSSCHLSEGRGWESCCVIVTESDTEAASDTITITGAGRGLYRLN